MATRVVEDEPDEDLEGKPVVYGETKYTMLECRGCGAVTLSRRVTYWGEAAEPEYYPPPVSRQIPRWQGELQEEFQGLMSEIYTALHANSKRLALMGTRALVDLFMNTTIGDIGGFGQKLDKLVTDGYLSARNKEVLDAALEAGHAAAHRGHEPTTEDVNLVFDIVENLVQSLVLKNKVGELRKHTPKRSSTK